MGQGTLALKSRIKSVDSTRKITKAMQLVASSKLKKQREQMEANKEYSMYLKDSVKDILNSLDNVNHQYLKEQTSGKIVNIVFTSNMGLCGGYNANVARLLKEDVSKDEAFIIFGSKSVAIKAAFSDILEEIVNLEDHLAYDKVSDVCNKLLKDYSVGEVQKINIVYTKFINAVSYEPVIETLLPIKNDDTSTKAHVETIFEPAGSQILDYLIPMYLKSVVYSSFLETRTSEEASRRMAMETATDNADELKESLELQFNQARQAAITQEISEIVAGADAL